MANRSIRFVKNNRQIPMPPITVSADAYVDRWTNRKAVVRSYIYVQQPGSDVLMFTPVEAERLIDALTDALNTIPTLELDAQARDMAIAPVEVEEN